MDNKGAPEEKERSGARTGNVLERQEKLEQLRALEHGFSISVVITPHDSVSVDTPEDLALVRNIVKHPG